MDVMKNTLGTYALIAGISLIFMAIAAAFSYGYVYNNLVVEGDSLATWQNLRESKALFAAGIGGWVIILITDILVAWSLYHYFKKVNIKISLYTAGARIIYSAMLAFAIYQLIKVFPLINSNVTGSAETVLRYLEGFKGTWSTGLIVFGIHLAGLGYLAFRSGFIPRIFGLLLLFAGICYFVINPLKLYLPGCVSQVESAEMILSLPMAIAEIGFAFWLIIRGWKS
jgi:hypothetical protein